MKLYIIDSCALITYFRKEKGYQKFIKLLSDENSNFLIHAVNLGEVYYDTLRVSGKEVADELFSDIAQLPIDIEWSLDAHFLKLVGKYKTSFPMAYADTFVLALAERENAIVISTDHHEFDVIEESKSVSFYWLR